MNFLFTNNLKLLPNIFVDNILKIIEKLSINVIYIIFTKIQMKYPIGIFILLFSIYSITDLAIKARYTRKRLTIAKNKRKLNS